MSGGLRTDGFMVGSCLDHARTGPAWQMTFQLKTYFEASFFVARAVFGDVGGWLLLLLAFSRFAKISLISWSVIFSWKGQYLVMLEGDSCCYAHCTGRFMCDGDQS